MNAERINTNRRFVGSIFGASGSRTSVALDSAYVHLTSGDALAIRYMPISADSIDELYVFLDAHGGTLGNITMEAQIYNEGAAYNIPGSTLRDTSTTTTMPDGDDKWIKFAFATPYTPAVGEILWIVIYNTSADQTTDYPSVLTATNFLPGEPIAGIGAAHPYSTANGFSGAGTNATEATFIVKQGTAYCGQPFTQLANVYASNQLQRGIVITPTEDVLISGVYISPVNQSGYAAVQILADATAPGGAAIAEYDLDSDTNETTNDLCGAKLFDTPVTLSGGVTYKVTITFGANLVYPQVAQIEDYASYSAMFDAIRAYDTVGLPYGAISDGGTPAAWTTDKSVCPGIALIVSSFPAIDTPAVGNVTEDDTVRGATGTYHEATEAEVQSGVAFGADSALTGTYSAGGGLLTHPGMSGGMRG